MSGGGGGRDVESRDYEDVLSSEVLNAPICDLCIVQSGEVRVPTYLLTYLRMHSDQLFSIVSVFYSYKLYICMAYKTFDLSYAYIHRLYRMASTVYTRPRVTGRLL